MVLDVGGRIQHSVIAVYLVFRILCKIAFVSRELGTDTIWALESKRQEKVG